MKVTRMDLDGAGSPNALVAKILKLEPSLKPPIPIEELALQLDIKEIRPLAADGFEGGLITDAGRSDGFILVNQSASPGRRRFTIGHELGHFLMTHHKPPPGGFQCSRADMVRLRIEKQDFYGRMEVEANEFSGLMLMPPPIVRRYMERFHEPDLTHLNEVIDTFAVSREVAARNYAMFHEQLTAVVVVNNGHVLRIYRHPNFPRLCVEKGGQVPEHSLLRQPGHQRNVPSAIAVARPGEWLQSDWGKPLPELCEQIFLQRDGFALIMLSAEVADADEEDADPDAERTAKQRYQDRQSRWRN